MAVTEFIDYLALEKHHSQHTLKAYKRDLTEFSGFVGKEFEAVELDKVEYPIIRSWVVHLSDSGLSNRSINRKIASLRAYYKFRLLRKKITINPLAQHRALKTAKKIEVPFSEQEMESLFSNIPFDEDFRGCRDRLLMELLYSTGMRRAELIGLKLEDVNLHTRMLKVLGKRNKERIIPILPPLVPLIQNYLTLRQSIPEGEQNDAFFITESGKKLYESLVYRIINRYLSVVSSKEKRSPHVLRHTFATHLLNQGADLNSVKELLGHASLASTQVYTHNSIAELKRVHQEAHPRNKRGE